jgi:hypothetical protein
MAGSWVTQGKKMCSRSELIVSNSGDDNVKLILASDLAQILEEKNLMLVGDGENFKVMHKMAFDALQLRGFSPKMWACLLCNKNLVLLLCL